MFVLQGYCTEIVPDTLWPVLTVHQSDSLWKETVHVPGYFGIQSSVAPTRVEKLEQVVSRLCDGSAVMFSSHFLTRDMYKSLMEGWLAPMILSAVLTVHCSLLLSCFEANPTYTVMDVQRTYWIIVV